MSELKKFISTTIREYLNENIDIKYKRNENGNVIAISDNKIIGELSLYDYWTEMEYVDNSLKDNIEIPNNFEFVSMIDSEIENQGVATNMLKYAIDSTDKNGIAISKLFIADNAVHKIMKKLNALSIPDWYLLKK
jgi:predicted GNAT family acetyltransferase